MSKKKNIEEKSNEDSFFERMRNDKKYSAKVQFIGWGIFLFVIILLLNINNASSVGVSGNNMVGNIINNVSDNDVDEEEEVSLLEKISNNYSYDINVLITKNETEEIKQRYYGKSFGNNIILNKESLDSVSNYYGVDGYYYIKNENNEFGLIQNNVIYDLVDGKYIELDEVLKLIDKASLDHVVDSSNDDKEYVYNLLVRDVVISNKSDDVVNINVVEGIDKLSIKIDYSNLLKVFDNTITKCEINYVYTDIDKVEKFDVMSDDEINE